MRSFVQVLTTPTADTPGTTLLLHFDNKRYLIGSLAEGTQRACVQMGARLLKVSQCFITGKTEWANVGGLLGMILTLADSAASSQASSLEDALFRARGKAARMGWSDDAEKMRELEEEVMAENKTNHTLTLFGPPNLNHMLATARRFIFRKGMPIDVHEVRSGTPPKAGADESQPYWTDENVKVWAIPITSTDPSSSPSQMEVDADYPRKGDTDEKGGDVPIINGITEEGLTPQERDLLTVKAVVSEMFDSSWRLDTLHETPLSSVRMPATIFVRNAETNKVEKYHGPLPGGEHPVPDPDLKVLVRRPWPGALVESLPPTEPAKEALSYIIRNHVQRGKFRPNIAVELKVEKGEKWSQLAAGQSVTNADGETVRPEQVLGESKDGGGLAVIDLPDPSYIDNLVSRREWQDSNIMAGVGAMFWICGKDVAVDPRIRQFMKEHDNLQHIISSPECCSNHIAMDSSAAATVHHRKIDPVRYRTPVHDNEPTQAPPPDSGVSIAARGQVVQLEPSFELQNKQVLPKLAVDEVEKELSQEILDEAARAHQAIEADNEDELQWATGIPDKDAEIITLGTGSALPSKYRNVSATLLRVPGWGTMLFDCGENTLGQLKRVMDLQELKQALQDLRIVVISHMHADHHLGTVGVIKAWYQEVHNGLPASSDSHLQSMLNDQRRLAIISEPAMLHWLTEYASVEDYGFSRIAPLHITPHDRLKKRPSKLGWFVPPMDFAGLTPQERIEKHARNAVLPSAPFLKLQDIQAVTVQHCHGARALSLTFPSGFKVSYSGDCRPSKAFAYIGKGSHVCIHEATFDDELQSDAEAKNHSTTSEALGVAQMMNAKACVLTHFSQRYQKLPVLEHSSAADSNAGEAEDPVPADDLPVPDVGDGAEDAISDQDPEMSAPSGPLEDAAPTFPDQATSNGSTGEQYDLPAKRNGKRRNSVENGGGPAAVRLKVASDMRVAVAFDYMRVKVGEIGQLEKFTPALLKLFAEEDKVEKAGVANAAAPSESKKSKKGKKKGDKRVSMT